MNEKIEKIEQELKQLSQKHLELSKAHQQIVKSHEEQKTLYHRLIGQTPLQPDSELESIKDEIEDLKTRELEYLKILQAAASIHPPIERKDWSKSWFYSKHLAKMGHVTPAQHIIIVSGGIFALVYAASNFYQAHHLFQLANYTPEATPQQIKMASYWIGRLRFRGFVALGAPSLFVFYMWSKRNQ